MNATELKTHFYKRFAGEHGRVVMSEAGLSSSLLGYICTDRMPSISCAMSMSVRIIARKIGSRAVTVTSTSTDMCRAYSIDTSDERDRISSFLYHAREFGINGAQLLCDNNIPYCFDPHTAYTAAAAKALFELSKKGKPRNEICAMLCARKNEINKYLSVFSSKKGYAVYTREGAARTLPLPMTGYKFLLINVKDVSAPVSVRTIEKAYNMLRELYPHISSFADVTPEMLDIAAPRLKSHEVRTCARHMSNECHRVRRGVRALTRCNLREFGEIMNESCMAQKRLCAYNDARVFLADELLTTEGIAGTRMCENGVLAIVSEDICDSVIRNLRFSYETEFGYPPVFCVADGM